MPNVSNEDLDSQITQRLVMFYEALIERGEIVRGASPFLHIAPVRSICVREGRQKVRSIANRSASFAHSAR